MIFARKVWHLLVAIKDGLALLLLLLFFAALYGVLMARPNAGAVREGALLLKLDGAVVEEPQIVDPLELLLSSQAPAREYRARDIVRALRTGASDDRVKAVVLDLGKFTGGGMVNLQEIGEALDAVRAAKKPVLTHAALYHDDSLLLAAHASEVWLDPLGGALIAGPGGKHLYYAKLLEKLKVTAHVFKVGTYKSAVEPYIRNDQSPEAREQSQALLGTLWESWQAEVAKARPKANIKLAARDPVAWLKASGNDTAKAALAAGLVDRIGDRVAFGNRVAELAGKDSYDKRPGSFAHSNLRAWLAANPEDKPGKPIGVVTIAGTIVDGDAGPGVAGGDRIADLLDEAQDRELAALVVRVDSPGGSVFASERIRSAIERWKARGVPVVVSMSNVAASGGYWVSTPASRIFAEPTTITGSIGVFSVIPSFERALTEWGVSTDGVATTPLSGQPDLAGGLSPDVSALIQGSTERLYARFLELVGTARGKSAQQIDAVGQGRVWDGGTARQNGLVDQFGGLDDALTYAATAAKLEPGDWHAAYLGQSESGYGSLLESLSGGDRDEAPGGLVEGLAGRQVAAIGQATGQLDSLLKARGVQAFCLECPARTVASPGRNEGLGLLARIGRWLSAFRPAS